MRFDSEIPIPGYPTLDGGSEADVTIRLGVVPEHPQWPLLWHVAPDDTVCLTIPRVATYSIRAGTEIVVETAEDAEPGDVGLHLRGSPLAALMLQRGWLPVHASAVETPTGALLFAGVVGSGKSVLACAMGQRGCRLLADDMSVLRIENGQVVVLPGVPEHRLWMEGAALFGRNPTQLPGLRPNIEKTSRKSARWCPQARPLRAVVFGDHGDALVHRTLSDTEVIDRLQQLIFRWRFLKSMSAPQDPFLELLDKVRERVPAIDIKYPRLKRELDTLCSTILAEVERAETERVEPAASSLSSLTLEPAEPLNSPSMEGPAGYAVLASFPKSGNTWVRGLLTAWRLGAEPDLQSFDCSGPTRKRHELDEFCGCESGLLRLGEVALARSRLHSYAGARLTGPTVIKTHDLCQAGMGRRMFTAEVVAGVIYIVRSPLDLIGSFANHFGVDIPGAVEIMNDPQNGFQQIPDGHTQIVGSLIGSWSENVRSWLDEPDQPTLLVRYEDILSDPLCELKRIIEFLRMQWDEERGRNAVRHCRFQALQLREREHGFKERSNHAQSFFRKGGSGKWRATLHPQAAFHIATQHGEVMRRLGYGRDVDEALHAWTIER